MNNMILKNNYYCFIAGLPEVFLDDRKLALSVNGFRELAREALKKEDVKLMVTSDCAGCGDDRLSGAPGG